MVMSCYMIGLVSTQNAGAFTGGRTGRALTANPTSGVAVADDAVSMRDSGDDDTTGTHFSGRLLTELSVPSWED